ncbi:MAG: ribonuclease Y, partial [Nitrospinota bacterium]
MTSGPLFFVVVLVLLGAGAALGYWARKLLLRKDLRTAQLHAQQIIEEAEREAAAKRKEAALEIKEEWYKSKQEFERETETKRRELQRYEQRIAQREANLDRKIEHLERKEREVIRKERKLAEKEEKLAQAEDRYQRLIQEQIQRLEQISNMTVAEAKEELKNRLLESVRMEAAGEVKRIVEEAQEKAHQQACQIISLAIERYAADYVMETTVSVVDLPSDDMKGRIIGREGRNIRALEVATGVDLIIDDTPEAVIISAYDPIRREIARLALERLVADGRIHPGRIEEVVQKVKSEMDDHIRREGEQAIFELGLDGIHPELVKLIGRLRYRTSYAQNVLQHSKEVAHLCGIMAAELGLDVKLAKRIGLLHDIGKAVDHQYEGTHTQIGVELARRYNESEKVVHAMAAHHGDVEARSVEAVLLQAADALSAA